MLFISVHLVLDAYDNVEDEYGKTIFWDGEIYTSSNSIQASAGVDAGILNGEKMKTELLIISCLIAVLLTTNGCAIHSPSVEINGSSLSASNQNNTEPEDSDFSDTAEPPLDKNFSAVPDFLYGYFDYGTYSTPSRISNPDQYDEIDISADNTLDFPESSVLAVIIRKWGFSPYLMEQEDAKIEKLFELLKEVKIQREEDMSQNGDPEQDSEISIVLVTGSANCYASNMMSIFSSGCLSLGCSL